MPGVVIWELKDGVILSGRFVPTTPLAPLSTYELSVSTAAKSPHGTPLDAGLTVEFTTATATAPPVDPTGPTGLARRFAYVWQGAVLVSNLDGSAPVALADEASRPAWSPDGTRIAFTRPTNNDLAHWQLCVARADGSDARCVVGDRDGSIQGRPSWSPDGSRIAFTYFCVFLPRRPVWSTRRLLHEPAGTEHRDHGGRYCHHAAAHLSLVVPGWKQDCVHAVPRGSGNRQPGRLGARDSRVSLGSYSVWEVAWSPDGRRFAFALQDDNVCPWYCDTAIGVVEADATQLTVLATGQTRKGSYVSGPAWSPDGASIAFTIEGWGSAWVRRSVPRIRHSRGQRGRRGERGSRIGRRPALLAAVRYSAAPRTV